ncbi:hypothetical protein [Corallococcus sp. CA054B]|uniref:hypothetical protein n=1 Tax=Corallococcus sp. CA054B TaxID=2316734 RepID=UPI0011C41134|nr:hypothetical protein [Corallococcus sp. CA054B]
MKAFTTRAWGAFFCNSSTPIVVNPSASCMSAVSAFVTSTTTLQRAVHVPLADNSNLRRHGLAVLVKDGAVRPSRKMPGASRHL